MAEHVCAASSAFDYIPVPLEIAATGPKTIRAAAHIADRIMLNVGNAPECVRWALDIIDEGLGEAGRSRSEVETPERRGGCDFCPAAV